jgi:hypothetical protein
MTFIVLGLFTACGKATEKSSSDDQGASNTSNNNTTNNTSTGNDTGTTTTGGTDTSPVVDTGVTYYDDPDVVEEVILPGTVFSSCGVAYKEMNSDEIMYTDNTSGQTYSTDEYSHEARVFLTNIRFLATGGRDAYNVCFNGYVDGSEVILEELTSQSVAVNPTKNISGYSHEICGYTAYQQSNDGKTYLVLQSEQVNYIILTSASVPAPSVGRVLVTASNGAESCYYSNKAPYRDYAKYHKPLFEAQAADLGAL